MKKIFLTTAAIFFCWVLTAQTPTPTRDTIVGREVTYHYTPNWIDPSDTVAPSWCPDLDIPCVYFSMPGPPNVSMFLGRYEYAELHLIDDSLRIIGLAVCAVIGDYVSENEIADYDWTHAKDYLSLYDPSGGTMKLLAREEFNLVDTARWMATGECSGGSGPLILPVFERYFERPVTVRDSFYVSCTYRSVSDTNQAGLVNNRGIQYTMRHGYSPCAPIYDRVAVRGAENSAIPDWWFGNLYSSIYGSALSTVYMFAIFDTTGMGLSPHCDSVQGLHQGSVWGNNTMLLWDSVPGQESWQLAVGLANQDPESYQVYNLTSPGKAVYNLEYNIAYAARVRARCDGRSNYSPWSDTIQFTLSERQGVGTAVERYTHLYPNPASDRIGVFSSFALTSVEVYDLGGRRMAAQQCTGHAAMVDVSGWPEGTYLAVVRTAAGAMSQKVTIKR